MTQYDVARDQMLPAIDSIAFGGKGPIVNDHQALHTRWRADGGLIIMEREFRSTTDALFVIVLLAIASVPDAC